MATRSRIGLELSDGSVLSAYHHWDGYPEWLGKTLVEHYNTLDKVSELIDGGDMSVCLDDDGNPNPEYYTQRGDDPGDCAPRLDPTLGAYADKDRGEEYAYVFKKVDQDYVWVCIDMHEFDDKDPQVVSIPA